jgi:excisionase family DNA binding protein
MAGSSTVPILIPFEPEEFWLQIRQIIKEEVGRVNQSVSSGISVMETSGLTEKPLYKISEVCEIFRVSRTTVHDWVKNGKLRKVKVRSRVYFLGKDIQQFLK